MVKIENDCVDCGLPCIGDRCKYRQFPHYYCDECGEELQAGELYEYDGQELCIDCIKDKLPVVKTHDY